VTEKIKAVALVKELGKPIKARGKLFLMRIPATPELSFAAGYLK